MKETRLNNELIDKSTSDFPSEGDWKSFPLSKLKKNIDTLNWQNVKGILKGKGGVYAFSFPLDELGSGSYTIDLDGPQGSIIEFWFYADDFPAILDNRFVLYVGRTTNLFDRLQQHLRKTQTATQVLYGMQKFYKTDFSHVKGMLLSCGIFHFLPLHGSENCVNRDMIELGLCVKYRAPVNIKSER